jgi:phosphoribosylglycinamide formyltransferase 1
MTSRARIAVLASGGGSNLQAVLDHLAALGAAAPASVALIASDQPAAGALDRARASGIPDAVLATPRRPGGDELGALLERHAIDLVVLAGYLRLVPADVVTQYEGRIINVHPSLLPAFGGPGMYGTRVHAAVLASGARVSGATVHLVDAEYDRGRILAQWPVPVLDGDDAATLAARVLRVEHLLLPRAACALAAGRSPVALTPPAAFTGADDDAALAAAIDALFR